MCYKIYLNILNAYCIDTMVILIVADKKILQIIIVLIKRFVFSEYILIRKKLYVYFIPHLKLIYAIVNRIIINLISNSQWN